MSNINIRDHKRNCLARKVKNLVLKEVYLGMAIRCKLSYIFPFKTKKDRVTLNVLRYCLTNSSVFSISIYIPITGMDKSEFMERAWWHGICEIFHPLINSLLSHFMIWASLYCIQCLYPENACLNNICYFLFSNACIISCMEYHLVMNSKFAKIIPWKYIILCWMIS